MRRFKIITNTTKDNNWNFTRMVCRFLDEHEAQYCIEAGLLDDVTEGRPEDRIEGDPESFEPEAVIVLGGDGTVLQAAGRPNGSPPILGINLGTVGYLAEIDRDYWQEALMQLFNGCYSIENRMMLEGCLSVSRDSEGNIIDESTLEEEGEELHHDYRLYHALNDAVIARIGALRVINYDVYVNGKFLNSYNADGIIVSTPTGSTGYNLSAGGPIVEPSSEMIVLTPICPHQINIRSILLSAKDVITIRIGRTNRQRVLEAEADFDGSGRVSLLTGDAVSIRKSDRVTQLIKFENRSFLEILRAKMNG